jgi:hypothetical protein
MLFYEKLNPFMVGTENSFESFERFIKRHLAGATHQIISIGNDLFFRSKRYIFLVRKSKPAGFDCGNSCPDMAFNDQLELSRKTDLLCDLNACHRMLNAMRFGPADVMEQSALSDQFTVKANGHALCKRKRFSGNGDTVGYNILGTSCCYQNITIVHGLGIIPLYLQISRGESLETCGDKKRLPRIGAALE